MPKNDYSGFSIAYYRGALDSAFKEVEELDKACGLDTYNGVRSRFYYRLKQLENLVSSIEEHESNESNNDYITVTIPKPILICGSSPYTDPDARGNREEKHDQRVVLCYGYDKNKEKEREILEILRKTVNGYYSKNYPESPVFVKIPKDNKSADDDHLD